MKTEKRKMSDHEDQRGTTTLVCEAKEDLLVCNHHSEFIENKKLNIVNKDQQTQKATNLPLIEGLTFWVLSIGASDNWTMRSVTQNGLKDRGVGASECEMIRTCQFNPLSRTAPRYELLLLLLIRIG